VPLAGGTHRAPGDGAGLGRGREQNVAERLVTGLDVAGAGAIPAGTTASGDTPAPAVPCG